MFTPFKLFNIIATSIYKILKDILKWVLSYWNNLPSVEKFFTLNLVILAFFLSQGWRAYEINFATEYGYYHKIYTDDFFLFFIFILLAVFTTFFWRLHAHSNKLIVFFRIFSLGGIFLLWVMNLLSPERIASTSEADFTYQFYIFGIFAFSGLISGFLGIINYTQKE